MTSAGRAAPARWPFVVLGVLAAAAVVGGLNELWQSRPRRAVDPWSGAAVRAGAPVVPRDPPSAYRIRYRIDTGSPLGTSRSNEVLSVLRPFQSSLVTTSADGKPLGEQHATLGKIRVSGEPQATVVGLAADLAPTDARLDASYADLVERGLAVVRERRVVLGRPCQVLRSREALQGSLAQAGFTDRDFVDSCVDGRGLLLAQVTVADGKPLLRRIATMVDEAPTLDPGAFAIPEEPTIPLEKGGTKLIPRPEGYVHPGASFALAPPDGYTLVGRYVVATGTREGPDGRPEGQSSGGVTDVWARGVDVLVLDQVSTQFGGAPFAPFSAARPVDLGPLGAGESIVGPRLSQVRVALPGGRSVRLAGTLPVAELASLARTLTAVPAPAG